MWLHFLYLQIWVKGGFGVAEATFLYGEKWQFACWKVTVCVVKGHLSVREVTGVTWKSAILPCWDTQGIRKPWYPFVKISDTCGCAVIRLYGDSRNRQIVLLVSAKKSILFRNVWFVGQPMCWTYRYTIYRPKTQVKDEIRSLRAKFIASSSNTATIFSGQPM